MIEYLHTLLLGYRSLPSVDKKKTRVLLSRNKQLFWRMMRSMNLKYKLEGVVFIVNIRLGFLLHQLVR